MQILYSLVQFGKSHLEITQIAWLHSHLPKKLEATYDTKKHCSIRFLCLGTNLTRIPNEFWRKLTTWHKMKKMTWINEPSTMLDSYYPNIARVPLIKGSMDQSLFYSTILRTRSFSLRGYANFVFSGPIWDLLPQDHVDSMVTYSLADKNCNNLWNSKIPLH